MAETAIEWATHVWNPVTGCDRVSPGCAHCYALELAPRLRKMQIARGGGRWASAPDGGRASGPAFGVVMHEDRLLEPLGWRKPRHVFVNSMGDLFHESVPDEFIARVFAVMGNARDHIFMVLTKRPERMNALIRSWTFHKLVRYQISAVVAPKTSNAWAYIAWCDDDFFDNVWLGVSIENRRYVHRADILRDTPAAVRFISAEPLLGPLVHDHYLDNDVDGGHSCWFDRYRGPELDLREIDWLIVGGESGPRHRPISAEWVRDLRQAARHGGRQGDESTGYAPYGTAFFFKQWGGLTPKAGGRELDGRTWDELPASIDQLMLAGAAWAGSLPRGGAA